MSQLTLDGASIPIKARDPEKELTKAEYEVWYTLKKLGPKTEKELHLHISLKKYSTMGNKLRNIRKKGYADNIQQRDKPQLWRAIPK